MDPLADDVLLGKMIHKDASSTLLPEHDSSLSRPYGSLSLTLSLLMITQEAFVDCVDQDQTTQNVQSNL